MSVQLNAHHHSAQSKKMIVAKQFVAYLGFAIMPIGYNSNCFKINTQSRGVSSITYGICFDVLFWLKIRTHNK